MKFQFFFRTDSVRSLRRLPIDVKSSGPSFRNQDLFDLTELYLAASANLKLVSYHTETAARFSVTSYVAFIDLSTGARKKGSEAHPARSVVAKRKIEQPRFIKFRSV